MYNVSAVHEMEFGDGRRSRERSRFEATLPELPDQDPDDPTEVMQAKQNAAKQQRNTIRDYIKDYEAKHDEYRAYLHR